MQLLWCSFPSNGYLAGESFLDCIVLYVNYFWNVNVKKNSKPIVYGHYNWENKPSRIRMKGIKSMCIFSPPSSNNYTLHVCFAKCLSSSWLCVHWCFLCLNYRLDQTCLSVDFYSLYRTWYQLFHQRMKPLQLILLSPLMNRGSYSSIKHGILMELFRIFLRIQFKCLMEVVLMPHGQA